MGKPLKCPFCEQCFATSSRLNKHKMREHIGWKCRFCKVTPFKTEYALKQHKKECHPNATKNKSSYNIYGKKWFQHGCTYCGLRFLTWEILEQHVATHDGLFCTKCNKLFDKKEKVKEHEPNCDGIKVQIKMENEMKIKKEPMCATVNGVTPFKCHDCGKYFPSGQSLGGHRASAHVKPEKMRQIANGIVVKQSPKKKKKKKTTVKKKKKKKVVKAKKKRNA